MNNAMRWAIVTFATGTMGTIIGCYMPFLGIYVGIVFSFFFALLGGLTIMDASP